MACFNTLIRASISVDVMVRSSSKYVWGLTVLLIFNKEVQHHWIYPFLLSFLVFIIHIEMVEQEFDRFTVWSSRIQQLYVERVTREDIKRKDFSDKEGESNAKGVDQFDAKVRTLGANVEKFNVTLFFGVLQATIGSYGKFTVHPFVRMCWAAVGVGLSIHLQEPYDSAQRTLFIFCVGYLALLGLIELIQGVVKLWYQRKMVNLPGIEYNHVLGKQYYHINKVVFLHAPVGFSPETSPFGQPIIEQLEQLKQKARQQKETKSGKKPVTEGSPLKQLKKRYSLPFICFLCSLSYLLTFIQGDGNSNKILSSDDDNKLTTVD